MARGEGLFLEFKHTVDHPLKVLRELAAFANTDGGTLLVGVGDDLKVRGLKSPEEDLEVLRRAIEGSCRPRLKYTVEKVPVTAKRQVLAFHVPPGRRRPYAIKSDDKNVRGAWVRVGDETIRASREVREILKGSGKNTGVTISYSETEQKLMKILDNEGRITLSAFQKGAEIKRREASEALIRMTVAGVLKVRPLPGEDVYVFNEDS